MGSMVPTNGQCSTCAESFPNSKTCDEYKVLTCRTGFAKSVDEQSCFSCNDKFPGALTCDKTKAISCRPSYYLASDIEACMRCGDKFPNSDECDEQAAISCQDFYNLDPEGDGCAALDELVDGLLLEVPRRAGPKQKDIYGQLRPLSVAYLQYWWDKVATGDGELMIYPDAEFTEEGLLLADGTYQGPAKDVAQRNINERTFKQDVQHGFYRFVGSTNVHIQLWKDGQAMSTFTFDHDFKENNEWLAREDPYYNFGQKYKEGLRWKYRSTLKPQDFRCGANENPCRPMAVPN